MCTVAALAIETASSTWELTTTKVVEPDRLVRPNMVIKGLKAKYNNCAMIMITS